MDSASGSHMLSESIWIVWFKTSFSREKVVCHECDGLAECEDRARIL